MAVGLPLIPPISVLIYLAVSFLHEHGFRFDLPITHGVAYLSRKEETEARQLMSEEDATNAALPNMKPKEGDQPLLTHIREVVTKWQSKPKTEQDEFLNIPYEAKDPAVPQMLDRYHIRLTHQTIRNEFPGLKTNGMGHFVQITNPTDEQREHTQVIMERQREHDISKAIGFRWLIEAIIGGDISRMPEEYFATRDPVNDKTAQSPRVTKESLPQLQEKLRARPKILAGHNCFTDLVYLYKCFIGDLPEKLEDFQANVHALFPAIVDTKHVASFGGRGYHSSLSNVYERMIVEPFPKIEVDPSFHRYEGVESYHEAGYDSLQTAKVLIKISAQMERDQEFKDEEAQSDTSEPSFGIREGYVTATESQPYGEAQPTILKRTITNVITSPMMAMKNILLSEFTSPTEPKPVRIFSNQAQAGSLGSNPQHMSDNEFSVVAVKQAQLCSATSASAEVAKIKGKSKFSMPGVYDILNADKADSDDDAKLELLQCSDEEERKIEKKGKKHLRKLVQQDRMEKMVEKGEMMPRWKGAKGFWRFFGNKLQVNGTLENVCKLP